MKNKLFSIFTALAMVLGILVSPFTSAHAADEATHQTTVKIHKILMEESELNKKDEKKNPVWPKDHDGKKIDNITDYFGTNAKPINGVAFRIYEVKEAAEAGFVKGDDESLKTYAKDLDANKYYKLVPVNGKDFVLSKTVDGEDGIAEVTLPDGTYRVVEDKANSTYKGEKGETLTGSKAVPFTLVLPAGLPDGTGNYDNADNPLHVYPKNTEKAPKIDKNFASDNDLEAVEDKNQNIKAGANYDNYEKKKATAEAELGKKVPYEVKTEIPADSKLAEAHWDDKMTEGLTFNGDVKVKVGETELTAEHYTLEQDNKGFSLRLNEKGLALINGKDKAVTVTLTYSATVNSKAIVDIPEANDITFHYGNTPSQGNTPKPTKPNKNGEVSVEKTWGGKDSDWEEGEYAKFKLVDANTGEDVKETDLDAVEGYKFESVVTLEKGGNTSYTWKGLKTDKSYKVVEVESKTLSDAEYTVNELGKVEVTNHKSNNPKPLNPTEPKVVNGGKRFVKTNKEGTERLAGAQFLVKNEKDEYLVKKVATQEEKDAVNTTKQNLDEAVATYNGLTADQQAGQEGTEAKNNIAKAQEAYNKAVLASADKYEWTTVEAYNKAQKEDNKKVKVAKEIPNVVKLTSGANGEFEIKELAYGDYKLEEIKAPEGYALPTNGGNFKFKVEKGSYNTGDINYEVKNKDAKDAQKIVNNKVSIPQTGGIGSLIFVVAGLAIMAGAYAAYRKSQARA